VNIEALIGRQITDIQIAIKKVEYEGSIPLEESFNYLILDEGEAIEIPYSQSEHVWVEEELPEDLKSIFVDNYGTPNPNPQIVGQKIIGIYHYYSGFTAIRREWDKCLIELESGFFISDKTMSPMGTGHAGVWIFSSKTDVERKIGGGFKKLA
jgi:hypothetical protein